jgi:hypothetical protein
MIQSSTEPSLERVYYDFVTRLQEGEYYPSKVCIFALTLPLFKQYPSLRVDLVEFADG